MRHNVLCFQVSMNNLVLVKLHKAIDQMFCNLYCLFFRDPSFVVYLFLESGAIAIFQNQNLEIIISIDIIAFHEIWTIELIHQSRLRLTKTLFYSPNSITFLSIDRSYIDELDCNLSLCFIIHAFIDLPIRTLSNSVIHNVFVNNEVFQCLTTFDVVVIGKGEWFLFISHLALHT